MSSNKNVPQSAIPSVALVTALSIFVALIDCGDFLFGNKESKSKDNQEKKETKVMKELNTKHGKNETKVTMKSRDEHRGVYFQNLILCDMSADQFWKYRKYSISMSLWWLVEGKTFSSSKARRRYIDNNFYYAMVSHGPLASPRWYDCFLLFRSTPEWTHQVKELVKAVKQLSPQECRWLLSILRMRWVVLEDEDKMPKSFLSHPAFFDCAKKCLLDSCSGKVKDTETYWCLEDHFMTLFL